MPTFSLNPTPPTVFPTDTTFDACFPGGGMRRGQLATVFGKSGSGKTGVGAKWIGQWLDLGHRVGAISLEMPVAYMTSQIRQYVNRGMDKLTVVENAGAQTPMTVASFPTNVDVIVVDNVALMHPTHPGVSVAQNMRLVTRECWKFAKDNNVLVVLLQQAKASTPHHVPLTTNDMSGGICQTHYCDYIFSIWKPEPRVYSHELTPVHMRLDKNRHGPAAINNIVLSL